MDDFSHGIRAPRTSSFWRCSTDGCPPIGLVAVRAPHETEPGSVEDSIRGDSYSSGSREFFMDEELIKEGTLKREWTGRV
jgi:hypothetical protein